MKKYEIWHDRPNCIACGACAAVTTNFFMDEEDQLASAVKTEIGESELEENKEAADVCPVNIIHVVPQGEVPQYFEELGISEKPIGKRE
jgi:ferredoxin